MDKNLNNRKDNTERSGILLRIFILAALLCMLVGPYFGAAKTLLADRFSIETSILLLLLGFIVSFSIIILIVFNLDRERISQLGSWLRELGLGKPTRWSAAIVGALVGIAWGILFLFSTLQFVPDAELTAINPFRIVAALLAAVGTILEDLLTRGYLMNRLKQANIGSLLQVIISALIFAIYHTLWAFNPPAFIASIVYGLILSGLFLWGKRSLTPVILAHSLAVLIAEPFATLLIFIAG